MTQPEGLLERDEELLRLRELLDGAREGRGATALVEGPAGQGKTTLLRTVMAQARASGVRVLSAIGSELERDTPFGVVRQALEPELRRADPERRAALLSGAAALAEAALGFGGADGSGADDSGARLHGLYWLVANLADEGPLIVCADDAQWADEPSLRFLEYLARRVDDLWVVLLVGARPAEPGLARDHLDAIAALPGTERLLPAPLSAGAVTTLLDARLEASPEDAFASACFETTGGNPLLVTELVRALVDDRSGATAGEADAVRRLVPGSVTREVARRLRVLPAAAAPLARAVAVLGDRAPVRLAATLAGLSEVEAAEAHTALAGAALLEREHLVFVHPLLRQAVLDELVGSERTRWHRRAAELLQEAGAADTELVPHVLATEPTGDAERAEMLVRVALRSMADGAPEAAARLLRRALDEPPAPERRADVLLRLGTAEVRIGAPTALGHLDRAAATGDAATAAAAVREQTIVLILSERADEAADALRSTAVRLRPEDPALADQLELDLVDVLVYDESALAEWRERIAAGSERGLLAPTSILAFDTAARGEHVSRVAELAARAHAGGELLARTGPDRSSYYYAIEGLMIGERPNEALAGIDHAEVAARRTGSPVAASLVSLMRAHWEHEFGDLRRAEELARRPAELVGTQHMFELSSVAALATALIDIGRFDEAEAVLDGATRDERGIAISGLHYVRGALRVAQGHFAEALVELETQRDVLRRRGWALTTRGHSGPAYVAALAGVGRLAEAQAAGEEELALARRRGARGAEALALGALALVVEGEEQLGRLREADEVAARCAMPLVRAQARFAHGAAMRRMNRKVDSRDVLREAIELAHRAGAAALETRAHDELVIAGAKPRSRWSSGVDALTPAERRVADHAARGMTNREIAEALFVTKKTVELHLGNAYGKLGIASRTQLAAALSG